MAGRALPLALLLASLAGARGHCEQKWDDIKAPHIVAKAYLVHLLKVNATDEYRNFMPNTKYQVTVRPEEEGTTFTRFHITVENEDKTLPSGTLEICDAELSLFSQDCPDAVVQVSLIEKDEISVYWTSPDEGSGCVVFRVSIMETPSKWFMDGSLEQRFCQDPKALIDEPGPVLPECCACDEAKYELAFEGLWSRYTHPKNFPTRPWSARFSDVIGASHTYEYRFWEYDGYASEGLKQVAENGSTRVLESELKAQSQHIRTIIKARGISFPNITSKTFAVFRVDQRHHLVSLVSMIDPSPDWFVGVSGLELCLSNCSWIEQKELNLYPVDAGTDDGLTYEALDIETQPRDLIRRITTRWPADERSPFFDETAIDMSPMARLYLKRQRIYEKDCDHAPSPDGSSEGAGNVHRPITRKACRVTEWGPWESCSVSCGRGVKLRQRSYKNEKAAARQNCDSVLTDRVICYAENNFACPPDEVDEQQCPLTPWTEWTPCTRSCGPESRTRERNFRPKKRRKQCNYQYQQVELQQTLDCENAACESEEGASEAPDPGEDAADEQTVSPFEEEDPDATASVEGLPEVEGRRELPDRRARRRKKCIEQRYTQWSFWTPCSVSCGTGTKSRSRRIRPGYGSPEADKDLSVYECQYESTTCEAETKSCEITKELMEVICAQPEQPGQCPDGHDDNSLRYYYEKTGGGKCLVFHYAGCNGNMNNFRTLQECMSTCGQFHEQQQQQQQTGGKKRRKQQRGETRASAMDSRTVDCRVSEWGDWSPCYSCKGYRTMSRSILTHPRNGGKLCPSKLVRRQKCHRVLTECAGETGRAQAGVNAPGEGPANCRVSPWGPWSTCTASCGRAQRRRIRNVTVAPRGPEARPCPVLDEIEDCRVPAC